MDEKVQREIRAELENIGDMFKSASVHGDQFEMVAMAAFEAEQIASIAAAVASMTTDDCDQPVRELLEGMSRTLGSLVEKIGKGMEVKKYNEAVAFGLNVYRRKESLEERIQGLL